MQKKESQGDFELLHYAKNRVFRKETRISGTFRRGLIWPEEAPSGPLLPFT